MARNLLRNNMDGESHGESQGVPSTPKRETQTKKELILLGQSHKSLFTQIDRLENILSPILRGAMPKEDSEKNVEELLCRLANDIRKERSSVNFTIGRIEDIIQRVEL